MSVVSFTVEGRPAPQGSKNVGRNGQLRETSPYLPAWRSRVTNRAHRAAPAQRPVFAKGTPVELHVTFLLVPGQQVLDAPDLDKLTRAVGDAITDAKVWHDDGQVTRITAVKRYPVPGEVPGALIMICEQGSEGDQAVGDIQQGIDEPMYAVDLQRQVYDENGDFVNSRTLFHLEGPADVVSGSLPAILRVLRVQPPQAPPAGAMTYGWDWAGTGQAQATSTEGIVPAKAAAGSDFADAAKPARRRRTKAEIEAARAAEAAGQDAPTGTAVPGPAAPEDDLDPFRVPLATS